MGYNVMDAAQAINFPGFIRPDLLEDENFSDYVFYTADDERGLLGMAVVNPQINGPELLSIAVIPSALRTGVGTGLLDYAKNDLEQMLGRLENKQDTYALFALITPEMEKKKDLMGFLTANGFFKAEERNVYRVRIHHFLSSDLLAEAKVPRDQNIVPLKDITNRQLGAFVADLNEMGRFSDFDFDIIDRDISMFALDKDRIIGCALFTRIEDNLLDNEWVYLENAASRPGLLLSMLKASFDEAEDLMPDLSDVTFVMENDKGEKLLQTLLSTSKAVDRIISMTVPLYPIDPGTIERMTDDLGLRPLTEDSMPCKNCKHCEGNVLSCAIYEQKPSGVLDGGDCPHFQALLS